MDDEVDWSKVRETEKLAQKRRETEMKETIAEEILDRTDIYRQMLSLMKPGESVAKTIRRLGGNSGTDSKSRKRPGQSQPWKKKRRKLDNREQPSNDAEHGSEVFDTAAAQNPDDPSKDDLLRMIGYADSLVSIGDMTVYGDTYEALSYRVKLKEDKSKPTVVTDPSLDMFGDEVSNEKPQASKVSMEVTTAETSSEYTSIYNIGIFPSMKFLRRFPVDNWENFRIG